MSIENFPSIQKRIAELECQKNTQEFKQFDCREVFSTVSPTNQEFLNSIKEPFNVYLNCLKSVTRWKKHIYRTDENPIIDDDYQHTLGMLKISHELKELGVKSVNFDNVEIMILAHDGGEIITDDISNNSSHSEEYITAIKNLEPKVFTACILKSLKDKDSFSNRSRIKELYKRYENRNQNISDVDCHLVKFIDMLQGDSWGLENVYSKNRLNQIFTDNNLPKNPDEIISKTINKEFSQLKLVLQGINNPSDKQKISNYFIDNFFEKYNDPKHGYQHLYKKFSNSRE